MMTSRNASRSIHLILHAALAATPALAQTASPDAPAGDTVVITASGFEQSLAQAPASITVITRAELEQRRVNSLAEALRGIEGVNVSPLDARDGKTGNQSISLRGLPREYTLVLIDGVRQNPMGNVTPNSFNDSQSVFIPPVAAIERIEVVRGPMSTLYGSDALGGVVNIITRKAAAAWSGTAQVGHTFQGDSDFGATSTISAYASGPLGDRVSLQLFGQALQRKASDIRIPGVDYPRPITADTPTMGQNPVAADVYTLGGKLRFAADAQNELGLDLYTTQQEYDNAKGDVGALHRTGAPAGSACNTLPVPNGCRGYEQELNFDRTQATLRHIGRYSVGTLRSALTYDMLETKGRTIPLNSGLALDVEGSARPLELDTTIFDTQFVSDLGNHMFTVGAQYIHANMTDGLWGGASNSLTQYSVFAEDEWTLAKGLALTGGLRYDDNVAFDGQWTPRLALVWQANAEWTLKGGVAQGFRTPYLEQLTDGIIGFGNQGTAPIYGNPDLQPEKSTNFEIGAAYRSGPFNLQATIYRNELDNLVEAGTGANAGRSLNIGEAVIQGVELSGGYAITPQLLLSANYAYTSSEVTNTQLDTGNPAQLIASRRGDPLVSWPRNMVNATLNWQALPELATFFTAEYRSSAFRPRNFHEPQTGGNSQGQVSSGVRDSNVVIGDFKGYTLLSLGATWSITKQVRLQGVIYNLLDKDFNDYVSYTRCANAGCTTSATGYSNVYNNILEPRRLWVSLIVDF